METSLVGALVLVRRVVPGMIARGRGRLIALNSYAAVRPAPHQSAYAAGKAGAREPRRVARRGARRDRRSSVLRHAGVRLDGDDGGDGAHTMVLRRSPRGATRSRRSVLPRSWPGSPAETPTPCRGGSCTRSTTWTTCSRASARSRRMTSTRRGCGGCHRRAGRSPARRGRARRSSAPRSSGHSMPNAGSSQRTPDGRLGDVRGRDQVEHVGVRRRASGIRGRSLPARRAPSRFPRRGGRRASRGTSANRVAGRGRRRRSRRGRTARASPPRAAASWKCMPRSVPVLVSSARCSPGRDRGVRPAAASSSGSQTRAKKPRSSSWRSSSTTTAPESGSRRTARGLRAAARGGSAVAPVVGP